MVIVTGIVSLLSLFGVFEIKKICLPIENIGLIIAIGTIFLAWFYLNGSEF